ncbi:hypothetical protein [Thermophilibacter provencensis]|uniref:Plasmid recombination enzyme n=1 Tax=Thermophilibacter provencensis TaxID=1852386 RepID=A0ABT7V181_9ACTN|nr:hypothetical protein [Thermophilibacter provencensis]MDM8270365.1 hypothetical protein [Thermophilibacter provencensis]
MGEKVKASVHSQRGGYSLAHNDGSLYREDNDKFKKGRRGNVHINPDGSELTGGRQVGVTVKAARKWYKAHLGAEYERAVHSDGWKRNPGRRKTFDEFCDMKRNQMNETILQVGNVKTTFDTTPALRAGLKAINEWQAGLNARAAANGSKARIETVAIDLHLDESPHVHKIDAVLADDGTMNMDAALKDMDIEKAHPPRKMIKPKGKRKARPETDKEYERRCTRVSTYTAEMRRVFEDAVDQWFAENGYGIRLDRERSDREHMELDEFRATHQRAYEQGVAAAEAEAKVVRNAAEAEVKAAKREAVQARRVRDLYAGESYQTKDGHTALGTKGLKAENARLRAENERLERDNAAKRAEGVRIDAANAARSAALDERDRALKAGEERLAEDRAKLDGDRAEATRLLDGYDRPATEADYLPPHDPANIGERVVAEKRAHDDYWAAYRANGHKPPTVHEPGLRETVKVTKEARAGYEQATEESRRERDALREFREGLVSLLEGLCGSVKRMQMDNDRKGRKATARFFRTVHGVFSEALTTLDDALVPEASTLDRAAWDEALSAAEAEQARAEGRAHATATARVPAPGVPREVRTDWEPRKQSNDRGIER